MKTLEIIAGILMLLYVLSFLVEFVLSMKIRQLNKKLKQQRIERMKQELEKLKN